MHGQDIGGAGLLEVKFNDFLFLFFLDLKQTYE